MYLQKKPKKKSFETQPLNNINNINNINIINMSNNNTKRASIRANQQHQEELIEIARRLRRTKRQLFLKYVEHDQPRDRSTTSLAEPQASGDSMRSVSEDSGNIVEGEGGSDLQQVSLAARKA